MLKKTLILSLMLTLLLSSVAVAEVTNRDMQLMGGVVASNSSDSFFFSPMESGMTMRWGLYALSSAQNGPIYQTSNAYPARMVHADSEYVYFMLYTDTNRTTQALYSVNIATGASEELLNNISAAFVEEDDTFLYVSTNDLYMLCRYSIPDRKATEIKSMKNSEKTMYDAITYKGTLYFTTLDKNGNENGYKFNADTNLANNLDEPSPKLVTGLLYEGYRVYTNDKSGNNVYAVKIGNKNGTQIGKKYNVSLTSPRFGEAIYAYDAETGQLVRCPLDGSAETVLTLEGGETLTRIVLGGSAEELLMYCNGGIYSIRPDLSGQTRLFDFSINSGGQMWSYIAPAGSNAVLIMGYDTETFSNEVNLLPTGILAYDRSSGEVLFSNLDANALSDPSENNESGETVQPQQQQPGEIGDVPVDQHEDSGDTFFVF